MTFWRRNGKLVRNSSGKLIRCNDCACDDGDTVVTGCCGGVALPVTIRVSGEYEDFFFNTTAYSVDIAYTGTTGDETHGTSTWTGTAGGVSFTMYCEWAVNDLGSPLDINVTFDVTSPVGDETGSNWPVSTCEPYVAAGLIGLSAGNLYFTAVSA